MKLRNIIIIFAAFTAFFLLTKKVLASEGTIELRSETGGPYRCWASSIRMQNLEYRIPFSCKYLIYPADENIFNYVVWINPKSGGNVVKLGTLGLGRGEFKTKTSFTSMFVTTESSKETKKPTGNTVMSGEVEPIDFLVQAVSPTPTPEEEAQITGQEEQQKTTQQLSTREKLFLALRRAGIAALVVLVALIGLIFVVTRSRG